MTLTRPSQAQEINLSGRFLEQTVIRLAQERGIRITHYRHYRDNRDLFGDDVLVQHVPYRPNLYGSRSWSEFVLHFQARAIRIECKYQEQAGSTDQKFPYFWLDARDFMPEREILIVLGGRGARTRAVAWLKRQCATVTRKSIVLVDEPGLRTWFKSLSWNAPRHLRREAPLKG